MRLIYRCLCVVLGAILGTGCNDSESPAEYGMPSGTIRVDGQIVDEDGHPVPGIRVAFSGARPDTTDAAGNWSIDDSGALLACVNDPYAPCTLDVQDVDAPDNGGSFQPEQVELDLVQTQQGSGWNQGTWEEHDIRIVVTESRLVVKRSDGPEPPADSEP